MDEKGVHTEARVEHESGRFVVYLDILMIDRAGEPAGVRTRRIAEYHTRREAEVAAHWFERAARRQGGEPFGL